jgi:hypothetical protein
MQRSLPIEKELEDLEIALLRSDVRKSNRVAELLADEFIEFGASGRTFTKAQIIASLQTESAAERSVNELKVRVLAPHLALVTYRVHRNAQPNVESLHSSIWQQRNGQWQMVFHQGTPCSALQ